MHIGTNFKYVEAIATKSAWISSYLLGKPTEYYVLTDVKITSVGHVLYKSSNPTLGPAGWALPDANVVELFALPGVDVSKAVAVKLKDGSCVKAIAVGTKQP